ncbi:DNA topoisomerase 1 [Pleurodeles waltl]|uniref:DNA topoisomerase 1 n=1 Tax=Pleurodeles waltl TaxID=8319 RepID=UPI003709912D
MSGDQPHNESQIDSGFHANDSHKHKDKHKDKEHRHKEHKKDKEKDREKSKHSNSEHKHSSEKKHKDKEKEKHKEKDANIEKHNDGILEKHRDKDGCVEKIKISISEKHSKDKVFIIEKQDGVLEKLKVNSTEKHKDKDVTAEKHRDKDASAEKHKDKDASVLKQKDKDGSAIKHKDGSAEKRKDKDKEGSTEKRKDKDGGAEKQKDGSAEKHHDKNSPEKHKDSIVEKIRGDGLVDKHIDAGGEKLKEKDGLLEKHKNKDGSSEKHKHKDGSSKHKDKHREKDKEKKKEKSKFDDQIKLKKEKENGFPSPTRVKDEPEDAFFASLENAKPPKRSRDDEDTDYQPKKIKTEDHIKPEELFKTEDGKKAKKRKIKEEEEDLKPQIKPKKKVKNKDKNKAKGASGEGVELKKKKPKKEEEEKWKWWEEERHPEGIKWKFLEHKGPVFAPPYDPLPDHVKFYYDGKEMKLSPKAEEVATFFAKMLDHEYTTKDIFMKNFFKDWKKEMTAEEREVITNLSKCNFNEMGAYFKVQSEARKQMSKEEKLKIKEENERLLQEYGFCIMDNHKERIANFRIEPPGLFRGRGNHPKMGKLKRRIQPEDIIINCSKDSKIPVAPEGHKWKEVRHDNKVTWLVSWTENIQGSIKYIMLNPSSRIKGEKDWQKYEVARKLKKTVDKIRNTYRENWKSKEMRVRQRAVALYFIDKLALRAGNEKEEGETADTVGCCSLRVEHIKLYPENDGQEFVVEFDFLGKDSIRYYNKVPVEKRVFKNLQLFMEGKQPEDDLFDRLNTGILNKHLQDLMEGLTAKVFRTYNASITLQQQLKELTNSEDNVPAKILSYNRANRAVAVLCNHQRAPPKTFEKSMLTLQTKIDAKKEQLTEARRELKSAKADAKARKDERTKKLLESKKKAVQRVEEQLMKLEVMATDREENKQIALGTSKLNYLDPRISVAWCKKFGIPIEKIYNKTQREKFAWAIDMAEEDYEF